MYFALTCHPYKRQHFPYNKARISTFELDMVYRWLIHGHVFINLNAFAGGVNFFHQVDWVAGLDAERFIG